MSGTQQPMLQQLEVRLEGVQQLIAQILIALRANPRPVGPASANAHPDPRFRAFVDNHHRAAMLNIALRISEGSRSMRRPSRDEKRLKSGMILWFARYWDQVKDILREKEADSGDLEGFWTSEPDFAEDF
jgi:hypothetical protein